MLLNNVLRGITPLQYNNLVSSESVNEWLHKCVAECEISYPLVAGRFPVAVDIGANIGAFCVHAHQNFDTIYAFEPAKDNYRILVQVLEGLDISNVEAYNTAVYGKSNEKLVMNVHPRQNSGAITCADINTEITGFISTEETCETISLSDIIKELNIKRIDYLKMDCEGSEYEILENFDEYDKITLIAMELHGYFGSERKTRLLQKLQEHYYIVPLSTTGIEEGDISLRKLCSLAVGIEDLATADNIIGISKRMTNAS